MLITSLIYQQPETVKLSLIDLKGGLALTRFKNAIQVEDVATDLDRALESLKKGSKVKWKKKKKMKGWFDKNGSEDIKEAGISTRHIIIVDEAAQISPKSSQVKQEKEKARKCEEALSEIASDWSWTWLSISLLQSISHADVMISKSNKIAIR